MQSATEELERLEHAFDRVKKQLFGRLHDIARAQLFSRVNMGPQTGVGGSEGGSGTGAGGAVLGVQEGSSGEEENGVSEQTVAAENGAVVEAGSGRNGSKR